MKRNVYKNIVCCVTAAAAAVLSAGCKNVSERQEKYADAPVQNKEKQIVLDNDINTRADPEIKVKAEEFMEKFSSVISVPDDIDILEYRFDTETHRGFMAFNCDDVLWNALVLKTDTYKDICNIYVNGHTYEISCDLDSDQVTEVHGAGPEMHNYRIQYDQNSEAYMFSAEWFLDDEGYMIALSSYSEKPIHMMPVEVFC